MRVSVWVRSFTSSFWVFGSQLGELGCVAGDRQGTLFLSGGCVGLGVDKLGPVAVKFARVFGKELLELSGMFKQLCILLASK